MKDSTYGDIIGLSRHSDGSFGVLRSQTEPQEPVTLTSPFAGIRQPTDLPLESPHDLSKINLGEINLKTHSPTNEGDVLDGDLAIHQLEETETAEETRTFYPDLVRYVKTLMMTGINLSGLLLDIENYHLSKNEVKQYLKQYQDRVTSEQYQKMLELIGESESSGSIQENSAIPTLKEEVIDSSSTVKPEITLPDPSTPTSFSPDDELSEDIPIAGEFPEPLGPLTKEETEIVEKIDNDLKDARSKYADELIKWKNKNRENKWKFKTLISNVYKGAVNTASDLGFERQMPQGEKPQELRDAEDVYIQAKKKKSENLFSRSKNVKETIPAFSSVPGKALNTVMGAITKKISKDGGSIPDIEIGYAFNQSILDQAEKEYAILQKRISDADPPLEKGILGKGLEKWSKMPRAKRILLTSTLLGVGSVVFGGAGILSAATYTAYRAGRSLAGAGVSEATGKIVDGIFKKKNEKSQEEILKEYGTYIDEGNFEEKERKLMNLFEQEQNKEKRQRLYKAGAMIGAGGVAMWGVNSNLPFSKEGIPSSGSNVSDNIKAPNSSGAIPTKFAMGGSESVSNHIDKPNLPPLIDEHDSLYEVSPLKPSSGNISEIPQAGGGVSHIDNTPTAPRVSAESPTGTSVETPELLPKTSVLEVAKPEPPAPVVDASVGLSTKGFIQDIHNLKAKIIAEYGGDMSKIPPEVKSNFLDKPSIGLAKKLGFYDAEHNASGIGFKGEHLGLDANGNVVYEHLGGSKDVVLDTKTGMVNEFSGNKMSTPEPNPNFIDNTYPGSHIETPSEVSTEAGHALPSEMVPPEEPILPTKEADFVPGESVPIDNIPVSSPAPLTHIPYNNSFVDVVDNGIAKSVVYNGVEIAHEHPFGNGKIISLDDQFQDGPFFKEIRGAFMTMFDKSNYGLGKEMMGVPFEGGRLTVIHGMESNPNGVLVLLNGKEIGKGLVTSGGPQVKIFGNLKGGWFFEDTVYERAFKESQKMIKTLKMIQ